MVSANCRAPAAFVVRRSVGRLSRAERRDNRFLIIRSGNVGVPSCAQTRCRPGIAIFGVEIDPKAAKQERNNIFVERPTNYDIMAPAIKNETRAGSA
jgi:hypothetical protein